MVQALATFSDLVIVSVQLIVTAYQFWVGITNLITPISGVLMGTLALANMPYLKLVKFVIPILISKYGIFNNRIVYRFLMK